MILKGRFADAYDAFMRRYGLLVLWFGGFLVGFGVRGMLPI